MRGKGEFGELLGCPALSGESVRRRSVVLAVERPQIGEGADGGKFAVNQRHKGRRRSGGHRLAEGQWYLRGVLDAASLGRRRHERDSAHRVGVCGEDVRRYCGESLLNHAQRQRI
ncbi:MAG: hypothetical protein WBZ15_16275 [Mycobacterium sp.]|uniref:hypothetical protein n=1 Tax=Mycobacterium sp. TaxID=1785 RepID=UPI003C32F6E1